MPPRYACANSMTTSSARSKSPPPKRSPSSASSSSAPPITPMAPALPASSSAQSKATPTAPPSPSPTPLFYLGWRKRYADRAAIAQPYAATFSGLYYRKDNEGPYLVPQRWIDAREILNPATQLNFVSTADIGGGDYGSAAINQRGELVGVTFDGNLESLPVTYLYSDDQARAVHVDV